MKFIVPEIVKIIKDSDTAMIREMRLLQLFIRIFTQALGIALETIDTELTAEYTKQGYQMKRRDFRTIQGLLGTITFERRRIQKQGPRANGFYPLDNQLGLRKYQRYTALYMKRVTEEAATSVYRTTADVMNRLTLTTISHQTVGNSIKQVGNYEKWEQQEIGRAVLPTVEQHRPAMLCIEGDGLIIKGQGEKRQEIHRVQVSEGQQQHGWQSVLVHAHYFAGLNHKALIQQVTAYLQREYDLGKLTVVSNSDGGSGYGKDIFESMVIGCRQHEHVLDRYPVNRKLKERLYFVEPALQEEIRKALREYKADTMRVLLDTAESQAATTEEAAHVEKLRKYIVRNWESLKPITMRTPQVQPAGIGACESNHRLYSYRMKKQGRHWSKAGGTAMVKVITAIQNKELDNAFTIWEKGFTAPISRTCKGTMRRIMKKIPIQPHVGIHRGSIRNQGHVSSAIGKLSKSFSTPVFL